MGDAGETVVGMSSLNSCESPQADARNRTSPLKCVKLDAGDALPMSILLTRTAWLPPVSEL